ncbi:MAG: polysaccharide biosynthesis/export family protein [Pseudomonadota bacterium]
MQWIFRVFAVFGLLCLTPLSLSGPAFAQGEYQLDSGDRLRIIVYGEDDLSGEFEVDQSGSISFPLIGTVPGAGLSQRALEAELTTRLRDGYLNQPRVSVEVLNYRPFFIIGEVNKPGSYPYQARLTVNQAVAVAGGFTYRADERDIEIKRADGGLMEDVGGGTVVLPGDTVRIKERFF